ncbi:hypothetical protein [Brucella pituitosa]|uniref:hypothetical protein n=1 Tax=Brucella pituitosa TaxID=571256 RepID=UPI0009A223FF|nr:hypothetical protein [Brucella pituitosa]
MTLINRLSKMDGPDPHVDVLIESYLGLVQYKRVELGHGDSDYVRHNIQPYTASVDAAIALAERVTPGCDWTVSSNRRHDKPFSEVILRVKHGRSGYCGLGATPAIALCIAILRAKEAN